jgi:hypothetical protein
MRQIYRARTVRAHEHSQEAHIAFHALMRSSDRWVLRLQTGV